MPVTRTSTDLVEEIRLPAGGSLIITDEFGVEIARFTADGNALKVAGVTVDENTLALDGLTASAAELNKLDGAGAVVASGTAHAHIADIANNATGTQIATAVNAVLDVLEAFGQAEVA